MSGPLVLALALSACVASTTQGAWEEAEPWSVRVAALGERAVVRVTTESGNAGSGFVFHPDGWVITNAHVVAGAERGTLQFAEGGLPGAARPFVVAARAPSRDLALLRIEGGGEFPALALGSSVRLPLGSPVLTIGAPQGMFPVVSEGVLAGRSIPGVIGTQLVPEQLIHGAPTLRGSSGCPVLDKQGRVVGIQSAKPSQELVRGAQAPDEVGQRFDQDLGRWLFQPEAYGLAIPVEDALRHLPGFLAPEWSTGLATGFELDPLAAGAVVRSVSLDSPAQRAGLLAGDRILQLAGRPVASALDVALMLGDPAPVQLVLAGRAKNRELLFSREPWRRPDWSSLAPGVRVSIARGRFAGLPEWGDVEVVEQDVAPALSLPQKLRGQEEFVLELSGWLDVPQSGRWELELTSDDGAQLFIRDRLVVDGDGLHGAQSARGSIDLDAGPQPVRVLYFEAGGDEHLRARWGLAGEELTEIPGERLAHEAR